MKAAAIVSPLDRTYRPQELNELFADLGRRLVLYPVAYVIKFEIPHDTGKTGAEFFERGVERSQPIRLPGNIKRRLSDFRAFPGRGQIEIRFGRSVVIQSTVKAGGFKFRHIMSDVIRLRP